MKVLKAKKVERRFSAKQASELTGVSPVMQRDWRRHGYLPPSLPGKKVKFSIAEICLLALMKVQVDGGKAVGGAHTVAKMSAPIAKAAVERCPLAVRLEGFDTSLSDERLLREMHPSAEGDGSFTRYLFFPNYSLIPKNSLETLTLDDAETEPRVSCYHFASLAEMESQVRQDWVTGQIFDLEAFAMSLALADPKGGPLITYFAVENEDE